MFRHNSMIFLDSRLDYLFCFKVVILIFSRHCHNFKWPEFMLTCHATFFINTYRPSLTKDNRTVKNDSLSSLGWDVYAGPIRLKVRSWDPRRTRHWQGLQCREELEVFPLMQEHHISWSVCQVWGEVTLLIRYRRPLPKRRVGRRGGWRWAIVSFRFCWRRWGHDRREDGKRWRKRLMEMSRAHAGWNSHPAHQGWGQTAPLSGNRSCGSKSSFLCSNSCFIVQRSSRVKKCNCWLPVPNPLFLAVSVLIYKLKNQNYSAL